MWKPRHLCLPGHCWLAGQWNQVRCYYNRFFKGLWFCSSWSAAYENCGLRHGIDSNCMDKGNPFGSYAEDQSQRAIIGSQSNVRCTARERIVSTFVSSVRKWYLKERESTVRLFRDDCVINRKIVNKITFYLSQGRITVLSIKTIITL
jgi:hypothetical protein